MSSVTTMVRSASRLARLSSLSQLSSRQSVASSSQSATSTSLVQAATSMRKSPLYISARSMATKGDADIVKFLHDEIATEKQNQKKAIALEGFDIKTDGGEVVLTKSVGGEKVVVSANVNHSVDSAEPDDGTGEAPEMLSRPNFEVDIVKSNGKTLSFSCSYISPDAAPEEKEQEFDDLFAIDEVTMFDGEDWNDKKYAVAGDIIDGYLYDLFMGMLDERGINNEFAEKLSDYCSAHEHAQYINLLEGIEKFAKM